MPSISNANRIAKSKAHNDYQSQCIALAKPFHDAHHSDVTIPRCFWCLSRDGKISSPLPISYALPLGQYNPEAETRPPSSTNSTQTEVVVAPLNGANTRAVNTALAQRQVVGDTAGIHDSRNIYTIETSRGDSRVDIIAPRGATPNVRLARDGKKYITFKSRR